MACDIVLRSLTAKNGSRHKRKNLAISCIYVINKVDVRWRSDTGSATSTLLSATIACFNMHVQYFYANTELKEVVNETRQTLITIKANMAANTPEILIAKLAECED